MLTVNDFQFIRGDDVAMGEGFPVDGVAINQRAETGSSIFEEVTAFPSLETEVDRSETQVRGNRNIIDGIRTNADASFGKKERVALRSAEFDHGY